MQFRHSLKNKKQNKTETNPLKTSNTKKKKKTVTHNIVSRKKSDKKYIAGKHK